MPKLSDLLSMEPSRDQPAIFAWLPRCAAFALALLLLLLGLPTLLTLLLSLQQSAATNGALAPILLRSLVSALGIAALASLLALAPAYLAACAERHPLGRLVLFLCILVPLADQVVTVIGWSEIGRAVTRLTADSDAGASGWWFSAGLTLLAELHRLLPLAILCQWATMRRADRGLVETALECGAGHVRILREIVLPEARSGIALGFLAVAVAAFGAFLEPALLSNGSTLSLGERLQRALEADGNWPLGATIALLMLAAALFGIWAIGVDWRVSGMRQRLQKWIAGSSPAMTSEGHAGASASVNIQRLVQSSHLSPPVTPGLDHAHSSAEIHGGHSAAINTPSPQPSPRPSAEADMRRQGGEGALPLASNTQITRLHRFDGVLNSTRGAPSPRLRGEGWGEGALATNTLPHSILAQSLLTPRAGLFCVTLLTIALLALPLIWMAVLSLRYIIGIAETAGLALFWRAVIHDPVLLPALGNTILIGLLTAALACFAGAGLASLWQVWLQRGAWRLTLLTALPLLLPGIALGTLHLAAHFFLASWLPGDLGIIAVLAAETLRATPLAALVIAFAWSKAPAGFTETVIEFGLERRRAWTQLLAPFLRPAYPAAFAACFLLAAGDFQLGNALSGDLPLLSPAFLSGLAAQRSPVYMALVVPILALTAALSWLILTRLGARPVLPTALVPQAMMPTSKTTGTDVTITSSPASGAG